MLNAKLQIKQQTFFLPVLKALGANLLFTRWDSSVQLERLGCHLGTMQGKVEKCKRLTH